jgi:VIT1/CCC1 family predicted Fe2+/Mn2+ transporter
VARLVPAFGPHALRSVLSAMKVRGMAVYGGALPPEPGGHAAPKAGKIEHRHRGLGAGGNLRAAVFGVSDGLVSNASLIMGIAGATADAKIVLLSGAAGLIAGAFSMAAGEFVSVRSQREMYEYQIGLEREELDHYPQEEAQELALIYEARGLAREEATRLARTLTADPDQALATLAREELGLNPEDLGSPIGAATSSFLSFAVGASIPLLPYVLGGSAASFEWSVGATAVVLFGVGAVLSLFTGRGALMSGARMLTIGLAAGGVTYFVGRLLGVTLG